MLRDIGIGCSRIVRENQPSRSGNNMCLRAELLSRQKKAGNLLDDVTILNSQKQRWLSEYTRILDTLSELLEQISAYTN